MPPYLPPAVSKADAFALIIQAGIVLPGNGEPGVTPAGAAPPGQFANWVAAGTIEPVLQTNPSQGSVAILAFPLKVVGRTAPAAVG